MLSDGTEVFIVRPNEAAPPEVRGDPEVLRTLGAHRPRSRRWLTRGAILLVVLAAATALAVWLRDRAGAKPLEQFVTARVERKDLRETVTATGTLSPLDSVEVGAEVTGRVIRVNVDINDQVQAGQVLVEIDPEQLEARVEEAAAQLASAEASLKNAKATAKEAELKAARMRELHQRGLVSSQELETAEAGLDRANAQVATATAQITVARAGLKAAKTSRGKALIRSPIDGIVLARTVEPGQTVTAGFQTPVLFTLARDLTQMRLLVDVDEADVGKVREGQKASFVVDAYPRREFPSEVLRLNNLPKPDSTVITYEALLRVDNAERLLRPGMTATATIVTSQKPQVLTVPNAALRFEPTAKSASAERPRPGLPLPGIRIGGGPRRPPEGARPDAGARRQETVYVVEGGQPKAIAVRVGGSDGQITEISSDALREGMEVIVDAVEVRE